MNVSLRELVVLIRRVLFTLRMPAHATASASRLIAQLELREGKGLQCLDELVSLAPSWNAVSRSVSAVDDVTVIEADRDSALLLGPSLLDLACANAKKHRLGIVAYQSIGGLPFAMSLDEAGAKRGFSTLVMTAGLDSFSSLVKLINREMSPLSSTPPIYGVAWSGWTSDDRRRAEGVARTPIELIGDWLDVIDGVGTSLEHRSATTWPALSAVGDLLVVCRWREGAVGELPGFDWSMQRGYEWVQLDRNDAAAATPWEREAMSHGVEVRASLWTHLEKTVFSGLAPVSDRSRLDAGATPDRQDCE